MQGAGIGHVDFMLFVSFLAAFGTQCKHKQHEMHMANKRPKARGPNKTYIRPVRIGGLH